MKCCLSLCWSALFDLQHRHYCSKVLRFIKDIFIFVKYLYYLLFLIHPSSYLDQVWSNLLLKYMSTQNIIVHNFGLRCVFWLFIVHSYIKRIKTVVAALKGFLKVPRLTCLPCRNLLWYIFSFYVTWCAYSPMLGHCLYTLGFMFPLTDVKGYKNPGFKLPFRKLKCSKTKLCRSVT